MTGARRAMVLVGVAASSAAVLVLEVALTRVFAVGQSYHLAFIAVSLALLGFGASGSALAVLPGLGGAGPGRWAVLAGLQAAAIPGGYLLANLIPFDAFLMPREPVQIAYLAAFLAALTVPFFFGGAVTGAVLARGGESGLPARHAYAASMIGSGLGALGGLWAGSQGGGPAGVALATAAAALGAASLTSAAGRGRVALGTLLVTQVAAAAAWAPPGFLDPRLSPYKGLSQARLMPGVEVVSSRENAIARVDRLSGAAVRSLPGLSFTYQGDLPAQDGLTFDGDDLSPVPTVGPEEAQFAAYLLTSLPFSLRPEGTMAVLEPRGGLDLLTALAAGAGQVVAVEPNPLAVATARETPGNPYDRPGVTVASEEPRAWVQRGNGRCDVIHLTLTSSYRPVASGAYSLGEDYRFTVEAFRLYLARLSPGGILSVLRWVQVPPSEETRLVALAAEAVRAEGGNPAEAVVALRSYANVLVMVRPDGFDAADLAAIRVFAETRRFDLVAAPGLTATGANLYNRLAEDEYFPLAAALLGPQPQTAIADWPYDLRPPNDNRPFFANFFTWRQVPRTLEEMGHTWAPFGGAGYFVLLSLLALVTAAAGLLLLAPLLVGRRHRVGTRPPPGLRWWSLGYFGLLGIGFLFVEIPLIQRYILLVGHPTVALAVVLLALLASSGVGSALSTRIPWRAAALGVALLTAAYPCLLAPFTRAVLPLPFGWRLLTAALTITPLGLLMGTMFPRGMAVLEARAPRLIPWAWAVNGTLSVISAVGAALLALDRGFGMVITAGAVCYLLAALLAGGSRLTPRSG
jgi:hypothetical protein